ncbi:MAG: hypothetical protein ACTSPB_17355 [Candidatus Thorarchaeota archaeon]
MALPDNRLRFSSTLIDFINDVGIANQDHDNYPPPQGQARFDHMRMLLIALLAQQSSFDEPTEYRDGTPWFDLNTNTLKIRSTNEWVNYSDVIPLGLPDTDGNFLTLAQWYAETSTALSSLAQEVTFSGVTTADNTVDINIPASLQEFIFSDSRCFLYVGGLLIDPRNCAFIGNTTIRLSNILLDTDDEFTVIIRRVPDSSFYAPTVSAP